MTDDLKDKIWQLAEPVATSEGMELIHVECVKMHLRWVFRLFLDKEGGVTLDDCTTVSNQLGDILDVHDLSRGPYTLEVSSPGIDRPISRDQDFEKFLGAKVKIRTHVKIEGIKNFQGVLEDYKEEDG
ncbi:MAG TPA: ribosome maturation factor RimP, partial [Syntrophaceae bacterium]|nr:ribosome maturation factor RimP [Syntrophaceae bacterium]